MVKALPMSVYYNKKYRDCANGGWTEENDELYVACEEGIFDVDENDPALFVLHKTSKDSVCLVPMSGGDGAGPMAGGSFAYTSDSRVSRMVQKILGYRFYGAISVHDRYETWEQYYALTR